MLYGIEKKFRRHLKSLGFDYVTLDLEGFRSGSMDEPHIRKKITRP